MRWVGHPPWVGASVFKYTFISFTIVVLAVVPVIIRRGRMR